MARLGAGTRKRADGTLEKSVLPDWQKNTVFYGKNERKISQKETGDQEKIEAGYTRITGIYGL